MGSLELKKQNPSLRSKKQTPRGIWACPLTLPLRYEICRESKIKNPFITERCGGGNFCRLSSLNGKRIMELKYCVCRFRLNGLCIFLLSLSCIFQGGKEQGGFAYAKLLFYLVETADISSLGVDDMNVSSASI